MGNEKRSFRHDRPLAKRTASLVAMVVWCLCLCVIWVVSCTAPTETPSDVAGRVTRQEVGPEGGVVPLPGGGSLEIPKGALEQTVEVIVSEVAPPASDDFTAVAGFYRFEPAGTEFIVPATATFPVASSALEAGGLAVVWIDQPDVHEVLPIEIDEEAMTVAALVHHFSNGGPARMSGECAGVCPGCCDYLAHCLRGNFKTSCGTGGQACQPCGSGKECIEGTCVPCGPSNCDGCCDSMFGCFLGNTGDYCGAGGVACQACDTKKGVQCVENACRYCNSGNCVGCCTDLDVCMSGSTKDSCGWAGHDCDVCGSGQDCFDNKCQSCADNCPGCCTNTGSCVETPTDGNCGLDGAECDICEKNEACLDGKCMPLSVPCDPPWATYKGGVPQATVTITTPGCTCAAGSGFVGMGAIVVDMLQNGATASTETGWTVLSATPPGINIESGGHYLTNLPQNQEIALGMQDASNNQYDLKLTLTNMAITNVSVGCK